MGYESLKSLIFFFFSNRKIINFFYVIKPGIILGNLVTLTGGFILASHGCYKMYILKPTLLGVACIIGSACIFNNILDRDIDMYMRRTHKRILCTYHNKILIFFFYVISVLLLFLGVFLLFVYVNFLSIIVSILGFFFYVIIYTMWFKRKSVFSILIGSVSGSLPPIIGYVSVKNNVDFCCLILFFMFISWQVAHAYSISIFRIQDYKIIKIPVTPIIYGIKYTRNCMVFSIFVYILLNMLLYLYDYVDFFYFYLTNINNFFWFFFAIFGFYTYQKKYWSRIMFILSIISIFLSSFLIFF